MIVCNLFFDPKVLIVSWKTFLNFLTVPGAYYRKYGTPLRRNKLFIWACQIKTANQKKTQKKFIPIRSIETNRSARKINILALSKRCYYQYCNLYFGISRSSHRRCSDRKGVFEILQNF